MNAIHLKHMNYLNADERHLAKKHATITKDVAVGLLVDTHTRMFKAMSISYDIDVVTEKCKAMYELYVKSLEG